jgi:hypothetical protein
MKKVQILKDVLIDVGNIHLYYDGLVPCDLWRALNRKQFSAPFEFVEELYYLSNGNPRQADITIDNSLNIPYVRVKDRPRGLSTFDKSGLPKGKNWEYYKIPAGTLLPAGLAIVKDDFNTRFQATHFTIAPAYDMPLDKFKFLLSQLASLLIKEEAA